MSNYWNTRDIIERERLFDATEKEIIAKLRKEYMRIYKEVKAEMLALQAKMGNNPTANELWKEDKYYKLLSEINYKLNNLGKIEINLLTQTFGDYYINNYKMIDIDFNLPVDNDKMLRAINQVLPGDGKNFSDRIWAHKRQLTDTLSKGLIDTVATGKNWGTLVKEIKNSFNTTFYNARRIVRTELSRINNQSALDKYEAEGITEVRWVATRDCRTCPECMELDGKIFPIGSAKKPPNDSHVNCRCCLVPVIKN